MVLNVASWAPDYLITTQHPGSSRKARSSAGPAPPAHFCCSCAFLPDLPANPRLTRIRRQGQVDQGMLLLRNRARSALGTMEAALGRLYTDTGSQSTVLISTRRVACHTQRSSSRSILVVDIEDRKRFQRLEICLREGALSSLSRLKCKPAPFAHRSICWPAQSVTSEYHTGQQSSLPDAKAPPDGASHRRAILAARPDQPVGSTRPGAQRQTPAFLYPSHLDGRRRTLVNRASRCPRRCQHKLRR